MPHLLTIRFKAFFLLTLFTANFYSICHCRQLTVTRHALSHDSHKQKKSCCCYEAPHADKTCANQHKPCNEKDGCGATHAVKFSLLEKQAVGPITLHPLSAVAFTNHFITPLDIFPHSGNSEDHIGHEWQHKHSPPDLQSLYQRFLI